MTDNELKDECMENAEIDLRRYSNNELTQIREAMRMYADRKLKLFAIPDVVGRSEQLNETTKTKSHAQLSGVSNSVCPINSAIKQDKCIYRGDKCRVCLDD